MNWTLEELERRNREAIENGAHTGFYYGSYYGGGNPSPLPNKQNKYGVASKEHRTVGLLTFASKAESQAYRTLLILMEAGKITELELQPVFKFPMGFEYRADFRAAYADGRVDVIDVKGSENSGVQVVKLKCMAVLLSWT